MIFPDVRKMRDFGGEGDSCDNDNGRDVRASFPVESVRWSTARQRRIFGRTAMAAGLVIAFGLLIAGGVIAAVYGMHRLCLWMEKRGWIYYKNKKPDLSTGGGFFALQEFIEPRTKHVYQIRDERLHRKLDE